jgi:amino acid transporter
MSDVEKRTSATEKSVPAASSSSEDGVVVGNVGAVGEYTNETTKGVEPTGHLHRKFKARHVQMIALAGNIGSGVFISIGAVSNDSRQVEIFLTIE